MNKMAIFVEGYTELVFLDKLITEIAAKNYVLIEWRRITGGTNVPRRNQQIQARQPSTGQQHLVVIHDCVGDKNVKTRMVQEYPYLASADYSKIICIRDVFPDFAYADIPRLERGLPILVKTNPIVVDFILSVMEVEAWFLAECNHYAIIDPAITIAEIIAKFAFDPVNDDLQLRLSPAKDLHGCYTIGGKAYEKNNTKATVDALDYASVYIHLTTKFPYLKKLVTIIEEFLKA